MEGRRGEGEACYLAGPGRPEAGEMGEEQREGQVEGEWKEGKAAGACCCERAREEQRPRGRVGGGRRFGFLLSCRVQRGCWSRPMKEGSTEASERLMSSIETLKQNKHTQEEPFKREKMLL